MTPEEAATVYSRLAYVVKILQEGGAVVESDDTRRARDACLLRALGELHKAMTHEVRLRSGEIVELEPGQTLEDVKRNRGI